MWGKIAGGIFLAPLAENFVKTVFWDTVEAPLAGSVVYCGFLFGHAEHSGVYVGRGTMGSIVSLSDDGTIVKESPQEFLEGVTTGDTIYVSCNGKVPVGGSDVAECALGMVGHHRDYNFILDNCHQFASGCLTGNFENSDNFLWMLKDTAKSALGADTWRAWEDP